MQLNIGTTARTRFHQRRCWLAATSGLSGDAQLAAGNGKREWSDAPAHGLVAPSAVDRAEAGSLSPHLLKLSLPAWLSGTMSTTMLRTSTQATSLLAAKSRCSGSAYAVQEGSHTARPCNRIANGSGFPACAGKQARDCNSLESLYPSVAVECDVAKNGFGPCEVTAYSGKEVWWRTTKRGSWKQAVSHRTHDRRSELHLRQV